MSFRYTVILIKQCAYAIPITIWLSIVKLLTII